MTSPSSVPDDAVLSGGTSTSDVLAWSRLGRRASIRQIRRLVHDPGALWRSLQLSRRIGGSALDFPVIAGPKARLHRRAESEIELGGYLFLGYIPDDAGNRRRRTFGSRPTAVTVGRQGKFVTRGWTIIGDGTQMSIRGRLELGEGTYINADARLVCMNSITIGAEVAISWDVLIMDTDEHPMAVGGVHRNPTTPITIGDHALIAARSVVLKGVNIGPGAVVAAQSVVTRDVPARALVAGAPARVVQTDVDWW